MQLIKILNKNTGSVITLPKHLKPIATSLNEHYYVIDSEVDEHWVTIKGKRILLNGEGEVIGGAGGSMNGMKFELAKSNSMKALKVPSYDQLYDPDFEAIDIDTVDNSPHLETILTAGGTEFNDLTKPFHEILTKENVGTAKQHKIKVNNELAKMLQGNEAWEEWNELRFLYSLQSIEKNPYFDVSTIEGRKKAQDMMKTATYINTWATSSGDHYALSCATQFCAVELYGLKDGTWELGNMTYTADDAIKTFLAKENIPFNQEHKEIFKNGTKQMLSAQYAITQKYLKDKGIDELYLYRGMKDYDSTFGDEYYYEPQHVLYQPLSSFTTNLPTAKIFGNYICHVKVPRALVQSIFTTGFGCADEYESVIIGHEDIQTVLRKK
jgi:hypothetical protein